MGSSLRRKPRGQSEPYLIIEVSDSTVHYDRAVKAPLYARHAIPALWLVNLKGKQLTFFRSLVDGEHTDITATDSPGMTPIPGLPGVTVDLSRVLEL